MLGACTLLNERGDVTLAWDEDSEESIKAVIKKKMAEGMTFFIIKPRLNGWLPPKRTKVKSIRDLKDSNAVAMSDEDFNTLITTGAVGSAKPEGDVQVERRATSANEVAKSETVALKPRRGG